MPKEKIIYSRPVYTETKTEKTLKNQVEECIDIIKKKLSDNRLGIRDILKQTIFLRASNNHQFNALKKEVIHRLKEFYSDSYPPTSYIGEPPAEGALIAVELTLVEKTGQNVTLCCKDIEGVRYITVIEAGTKTVYAAGLASGENTDGTHRQAEEAFKQMEQVLSNENVEFSQIVRQWNYIENITGVYPVGDGVRQNYQAFNDIRSSYYGTSDFHQGYPAATGIGMGNGGVVLEFVAVQMIDQNESKNNVIPLKNPDQIDAHRYSQEVLVGRSINGQQPKTTPKFERAKAVKLDPSGMDGYVIYISGTAAIQGQIVAAPDDVEEQTRITIANIEKLVALENLENHGLKLNAPQQNVETGYSHLRVYVKRESDTPLVKAVCESVYKHVPTIYLVSDICRDALLVEIEGAMHVTAKHR
jgi:enamine deaminase RidA (YjgF/YER057c/UK114 family)